VERSARSSQAAVVGRYNARGPALCEGARRGPRVNRPIAQAVGQGGAVRAKVRMLIGADPALLAERVLQEYAVEFRSAQQRREVDTLLWLTPTRRAQRTLTTRLVQTLGQACWTPRLHTFDSFAEWLLRRAGQPATSISSTVRRLLLRRITQRMAAEGELPYFAAVAHTSGFLDVVEAFIAELKRDEIWPDEFLRVCRETSAALPRDEELGAIYQRYQDLLHQQRWYDGEGRFWLARTELAEARCDPLAWSYVAVAGFTDFSRTQRDILRLLAQRTRQLVITLPCDPRRPELFSRSLATQRGLETDVEAAAVTVEPIAADSATDTSPSFRRAIRDGLFAPPGTWQPLAQTDGLCIVAAMGTFNERSAVAERIKSLLAAGVAPGDIVVGLRSLHDDGAAWTKSLREAGIPAWCEIGPPLREQGLVKFLFAVLTAEIEDWSFVPLLRVFHSSFFQPAVREFDVADSVRAVAALLRRLRLTRDREFILARALSLAGLSAGRREERTADPAAEAPLAAVGRRAWPLLHWYSQHTEALRKPHALQGWIDVLAKLVSCLGCVKAASHANGADPAEQTVLNVDALGDAALWDRVQRMLRDAAEAELRLDSPPPQRNLADFLAELRDLLSDERLDPPPESAGYVRVLSCEQLRHVSYPHVFLANVTEDSFPRRRGEDCLLSDAERERLAQRHQFSLLHHQQHLQDEMLFFNLLLLSARQSLTISYPAVDQEGQPSYPSPYLASLLSVFAPGAVRMEHHGRLDPLPEPGEALTATDLRLLAMQAALEGDAGWLRSLAEQPRTQSMVHNVLAAVDMARHRFHTPGFTVYEGRLESPVHVRSLAQQYGAEHHFSATELEAYAACPFRFWLTDVLKVAVPVEPTEATDRSERGQIVHSVLAELLAPMQAGLPAEQLAAQFRQLVAQRLQRTPTHSELQAALTRIEQQLLDEWADAYSQQADRYLTQVKEAWSGSWRAAHSEIAFGKAAGQGPQGQDAVYGPLEVGGGADRVLLCGRIDRVDIGWLEDRPVYTVIDYKTGRPPRFTQADLESGRAVQLTLYTLAVQRLGITPPQALPFQMGYWCLQANGFRAGPSQRGGKTRTLMDAAVWGALVETLESTVLRLVAGIRRGEFVVENADTKCTGGCEFRTVCRVNQVRPLADALRKRRREESVAADSVEVDQ